MFAQVRGRVLVNSSRGILAVGPESQALQGAVSAAQAELSPELSAA